jgi:chemotaxis protein histidine kinase CheA
VHLFRNSVDHGIESPELRSELGKEPEGNISIHIERSDELFVLEYRDDGRGIDPKAIRNKMKKLNYPQESLQEPDESIIYHIFDSEFSTSEEVTDLSGRGVGLHDLYREVNQLKGNISVISIVGEGTKFIFKIPL